MSIYDTIEELKSEYTSEADRYVIEGWEKELMELAPKIDLAKVKPIRERLESLAYKIRSNKVELEDPDLPEEKRRYIIAEIKVYNEELNFYGSAKNYAKYLVENIDNAKKSLK